MSDINTSTRFAARPLVADQLLGISDDCLMLQHSGIKMGLNLAFGSVLTFIFMGFPAILLVIIGPLLPPYGYNEDNSVATLADIISVYSVITYMVFVVVVIAFIIFMTLFLALLAKKGVSKNVSPMVFNYPNQTVTAVHKLKEITIPWHEIKGSVGSKTSLGPGLVPMTRGYIYLDGVGQIEGDEALWEYIQTFMHEGPNGLSVMPYISDSWDHQPLYSRTFKQSINHHWFWPIVRNPGLGKIISWLIWPIKIAGFIPFIMTDWFWRRMMLRAYRKNPNNFPEQRFKACAGKKITGQMATEAYSGKEDLDTDGINYLELKRRLKL